MKSQKLTRREFMRLSALTAAGVTLAACGAQPTPVPSTAVPPTAAPAATSSATHSGARAGWCNTVLLEHALRDARGFSGVCHAMANRRCQSPAQCQSRPVLWSG